MRNLFLIAVFSVLLLSNVFGQRDNTLFNTGAINLTGGWGGMQTAITSINGELSSLQGGFGGVEFNKNFFIGGGGYSTTTFDNFDQFTDTYETSYGGLILGYSVKSHKVVHPQATLLVGGGWQQEPNSSASDMYIAQPAVGVEINVFRWFRLGLHGGYRIVIDDQFTGTDATFSGGYGSISFKFGWSWGK